VLIFAPVAQNKAPTDLLKIIEIALRYFLGIDSSLRLWALGLRRPVWPGLSLLWACSVLMPRRHDAQWEKGG
jgi:hypothetical protein